MNSVDKIYLNEKINKIISILNDEQKNKVIQEGKIYIWRGQNSSFLPQPSNSTPLSLFCGIDDNKNKLIANTLSFAKDSIANNALLWGAKGMGKTSLVKAIFHFVNDSLKQKLTLIEVLTDDLNSIPELFDRLRSFAGKIIIFCDDLAFDDNYHPFKALFNGEMDRSNILLYATSNRRHILERDMTKEQNARHQKDELDEKTSLTDRFGLKLAFHPCALETFHNMVRKHAKHYDINDTKLIDKANLWAQIKGDKSGRAASQFIANLKTKKYSINKD